MQNLNDVGLPRAAAARLGWWFDAYVGADGAISMGHWEDSCPFQFADGFADYGEIQAIFTNTARALLANGDAGATAWIAQYAPAAARVANYSLIMRRAAAGNASQTGVIAGMIWGPPEHDTCHEPGWYTHNNAWFVRGMREMGRFLVDVCPTAGCADLAAFGAVLAAEAVSFLADFTASVAAITTLLPNNTAFVPPVHALGYAPFGSMIESVVAEYSNFRYYAELLGAGVLTDAQSAGLQVFRETHRGTVSGITRWSDHLDDMPSSYYAYAALRDDRLERFFLLQYGHMANYMGRGTLTATEQLPITGDSNGVARDYLWSYLEGGIDECIPSIMLSAYATRLQLVLETPDEDTIWLAKGAPRRWFAPAGGGFSVARALTRFGAVDVAVASAARAGGGERATASVAFRAGGVPGVTPAPLFALRLRSSFAGGALDAASVSVSGVGARLASVDAARGLVFVSVDAAAEVAFAVVGDLA